MERLIAKPSAETLVHTMFGRSLQGNGEYAFRRDFLLAAGEIRNLFYYDAFNGNWQVKADVIYADGTSPASVWDIRVNGVAVTATKRAGGGNDTLTWSVGPLVDLKRVFRVTSTNATGRVLISILAMSNADSVKFYPA
jgi:hypothetical protein